MEIRKVNQWDLYSSMDEIVNGACCEEMRGYAADRRMMPEEWLHCPFCGEKFEWIKPRNIMSNKWREHCDNWEFRDSTIVGLQLKDCDNYRTNE